VNVFIGRQFGHDLIQETPGVFALLLFRGLGIHLPAGISSAANRFSVPFRLQVLFVTRTTLPLSVST